MREAVCCPLSGNEGSRANFYSQDVVTTRKVHRCSECCEEIPARSRCEVVRGMWDGSWATYRTCLSCVEIRDHFQCDGWIFGQLWCDLKENFFPTMTAGGPCMEGLSPEARDRLFERRTAWLLTHTRYEWAR